MRILVPPRVVRRLANPLWVPAAVVITGLLVPVLAVGALLGLRRGGRRRLLRLTCLAIVYLWIDVALLLACWGLWLRWPDPRRDPTAWHRRHTALLRWALASFMRAAEHLLGFHVLVDRPPRSTPEAAPGGGPLIVLARHAGPGDSFTIVHLLMERYGRRPKVVLKAAMQLDPGLDILLNRLEWYFLPSVSGAGDDRTEAVRVLAQTLTPDEALLLFPEGGNWTPRRHVRAVRSLLRGGDVLRAHLAEAHEHVLPPRPAGAVACLTARTDTDVVVVAHCGLDELVNPALMWDALPVDQRPMRVHWWLTASTEVPRQEELALVWVDSMWARVDEWVDQASAGPVPTSG